MDPASLRSASRRRISPQQASCKPLFALCDPAYRPDGTVIKGQIAIFCHSFRLGHEWRGAGAGRDRWRCLPPPLLARRVSSGGRTAATLRVSSGTSPGLLLAGSHSPVVRARRGSGHLVAGVWRCVVDLRPAPGQGRGGNRRAEEGQRDHELRVRSPGGEVLAAGVEVADRGRGHEPRQRSRGSFFLLSRRFGASHDPRTGAHGPAATLHRDHGSPEPSLVP